MIPIPQQAVRGQVLTADMINAIHRTLRRLRPIAGANIHLQEGDAGIIISAGASTLASRSTSTPFSHRFKLTASHVAASSGSSDSSDSSSSDSSSSDSSGSTVGGNIGSGTVGGNIGSGTVGGNIGSEISGGSSDSSDSSSSDSSGSSASAEASWLLTIQAGSLWEVADGVATEKTFTLLDGVTATASGWKVEDASSGALYIARTTKGEDKSAANNTQADGSNPTDLTDTTGSSGSESTESTESDSDPGAGYKLCFGSDTSKALYVIAEFDSTASSPVIQRVVGDVFYIPSTASSTEETPCAWRVRWNEESQQWQIFYPLWVKGQDQLLAEGYSTGWTALASTLQAEGTLYATLHWLGTLDEDTGKTSWTLDPATPQIVNSLQDIPADSTPSGSGSSATQGHKTIVVTIGTFTTSSTVSDDASESEKLKALAFEQVHEGAIVETFTPATSSASSALPDGLKLYGRVSFDETTATFSQAIIRWKASANAFVDAGFVNVMSFAKQAVEFVKEVSVGKEDVADSSTSSGSSSVDALRAIVSKGTRWGLTPPADDTSSTKVLLQFAPHTADEKTPYSSSFSSDEADNP